MTTRRTKSASAAKAMPKAKTTRRNDPGVKVAPAVVVRNGRAPAPARAKAAPSGAKRAPKVARPGAGARLRAELAADGDPYGVTVLINQAARVADRLEVLDRLLSGDPASWIHLEAPRIVEVTAKVVEVRVDVRVDNPVLEERQQTTVLRHLLSEIHRQRAGVPMGGDDDDDLDGI